MKPQEALQRPGTGGGRTEKTPPTAQATRTQGANGGDGTPRGKKRAAEPPATMETAEEDGSEGPRPAQSDGADGARSEHCALARCEYDIMALEATEGGQARAGAASREDGHGVSENREGTGTDEEGDETPQRALPARKTDRGHTKVRSPPERLCALNTCGRQGGEGGGGPPTQKRASTACSGGTGGGGANTAAQDPPARPGLGSRGGGASPAVRATRAQA